MNQTHVYTHYNVYLVSNLPNRPQLSPAPTLPYHVLKRKRKKHWITFIPKLSVLIEMESFFREFIYITYHLHVSWYFHGRRTVRCLWRCHGNGWRSIVLCIIITRTFAMILTWKFWVARRFRGAMTYFYVFYAFFRDCWRLIKWPSVRYKRLPKFENF